MSATKTETGRYFFHILHTDTKRLMLASTIPYESAELARAAGDRERREHGWTLGYGYHTEVEAETE